VACAEPVSRHLEEMRADGIDAVVAAECRIVLRRSELAQSRVRAVDHRDRDNAVEGHHGSGRDRAQQLVEPQDLSPVGVLSARRFVVNLAGEHPVCPPARD